MTVCKIVTGVDAAGVWAIRLVDDVGRVWWEGWSFGACVSWARGVGVRIVRDEPQACAVD